MLTKILLNDIILKRSDFMDAITAWDLSVLHFVENNFQNPFLTFFFKIFTYASEAGIIWIVFAVLLLIFAHMFNLVMGILGVYIHDGRLQYVEFFGKFYTGDGQLFVPFGCDTRYTLLK